ncbi:MAG: hypothetical protein ACO3EZ_14425 [Prochlorotrichaceae cyanobacterium]|jgi:hypothetical protein
MTEPGYFLNANPSHWDIWNFLKELRSEHPEPFNQAIQDLFINELQDIRMEAAELSQELARTEADLDLAEQKLKLIRKVLDEPNSHFVDRCDL